MECKQCKGNESKECEWFITNEGNFCSVECMNNWRFIGVQALYDSKTKEDEGKTV